MIAQRLALNYTLIYLASQAISDAAIGSLLSSADSSSMPMEDYRHIDAVDLTPLTLAFDIQNHAKSFLRLKHPSNSDRQHFVQMTADSLGKTFSKIIQDQFKGTQTGYGCHQRLS